jgi:MoaA/NifB/PqqE/SkfB family radical SAM enzyme
MKLEDLTFAIDVLARNGYAVAYFTGGETALYPQLVEAVEYARKRGMITSVTTNGSIPETTLRRLSGSLDVLSVSVDHYDEAIWDKAKSVPGISKEAKETIRKAKAYGMKLYGITFLNPAWTPKDVENVVRYVDEELGVSFGLSYPYISSSDSTFVVGGNLPNCLLKRQHKVRDMVAKILQMKLSGSRVSTASCYMRDVLRVHEGVPPRYPCKAGTTIISIDCDLNVYPCYKRQRLFNLRECQDLNIRALDTSKCDNTGCLINCFKEASLASRETIFRVVKEEFFSNPKFYFNLLGYNREQKFDDSKHALNSI